MLFAIPPLVVLATYASAAPTSPAPSSALLSSSSVSVAPTPSGSAAQATPTVAYASDDPNGSFWSKFQSGTPEPERGTTGTSILGPQNIPLERQGPDFLAPPDTDSGSVCVTVFFLLFKHEAKSM